MTFIRIVYISLFTINLSLVLKSFHIRKYVSQATYKKHVWSSYKFHSYATVPIGLLIPFLSLIFRKDITIQTISYAIIYIIIDFLLMELVDIESVIKKWKQVLLKNSLISANRKREG